MDWKLVTFIVCSFGFFKDLRPSEAYLTPYLTGHWKNLTDTEVNNEIYPWWTYSYLIWLVPMFLITDFLRYKPVLMLDGVAYIVTWVLLLWAQGVPAMKSMQVVYGLATACEIGYYSYLFAVVSQDKFKKVASFSRAASLLGKFVAYLLSQLFVYYELLDYFQLNIFSFVSVCIAFVITCILPRARYSELFHEYKTEEVEVNDTAYDTPHEDDTHRSITGEETVSNNEDAQPESTSEYKGVQNKETDQNNVTTQQPQSRRSVRNFISFLWFELRTVYSSKTVAVWSLWWAFASCGNFQVGNYIQNLWKKIAPHKSSRHTYNGAVEAAGTLFSTITVLLIGYLPVDWSVRGRAEGLMALVCAFNAAFLIIMGRTTEIWVAYVLYDVFRATYQIVITIASAQIARALARQRYGFVFGCNTFIALLVETILTAVVVDESGLGVDIRTQFIVYGCYFVAMAVVFLIVFFIRVSRKGRQYETDQSAPGIVNEAYSVQFEIKDSDKQTT